MSPWIWQIAWCVLGLVLCMADRFRLGMWARGRRWIPEIIFTLTILAETAFGYIAGAHQAFH
jgi:hypothetical protein